VRDVYRLGEIVSAQLRAIVGIALIIAPRITTEISGVHQMWEDRHVRLAGKAFTQLLNIFPSPQGVYMTSNVLIEKDFLDQQGILTPGLVKGPDLSKIAGTGAPNSFGSMDVMDKEKDSLWHALGWAFVPSRHDPAEVVLLAGEDGNGHAIAFAQGLAGGKRPDVVKVMHDRAYKTTGWGITFKAADVPPGTKTISAWVYDPETGRAYRLGEGRPFIPL
jgi:hypothetical protein